MRERERERERDRERAAALHIIQYHRMRGLTAPEHIAFRAVLISSRTKKREEKRREENTSEERGRVSAAR
jgi:hypothetical protein